MILGCNNLNILSKNIKKLLKSKHYYDLIRTYFINTGFLFFSPTFHSSHNICILSLYSTYTKMQTCPTYYTIHNSNSLAFYSVQVQSLRVPHSEYVFSSWLPYNRCISKWQCLKTNCQVRKSLCAASCCGD